jgi:hypothetical protein
MIAAPATRCATLVIMVVVQVFIASALIDRQRLQVIPAKS